MSANTFSVDTHVFRELGELLVGRDSTALLELIKNSYDADATLIIVTADDLGNLDRGSIVIQDNGHGMTESGFQNGFLTIASRFKEGSDRKSAHFRRRYTGSKGVGRLAAHKLAKHMQVDSVYGNPGHPSMEAISASIDWERIEEKETLAQLTDEISLRQVELPEKCPPGTVITLSKLRRPWTNKETMRFISECRSFLVPDVLTNPIPKRVLPNLLLFNSPQLRDTNTQDRGCDVRLGGDFLEGDDYWTPLVDLTDWILEIDCKSDKRLVKYCISPSIQKARLTPNASVRKFQHPHPNLEEGPFFQARILVRDRKIQSSDLLAWSRQQSGIRVYMEGFRVLPYGEAGDDWLSIDSNYTRRSWQTDEVFDSLILHEEEAGDWQLSVLSNRSYTGAVFLTQENAPTLRMLVNREGFVIERAFDDLTEILKRGIDLVTRARAAATFQERENRRRERELDRQVDTAPLRRADVNQAADGDNSGQDRTFASVSAFALEAVQEARRTVEAGADPETVAQRLTVTQAAIADLVDVGDKLSDSAAMLRVLASLGMQMASFVHEIRGLLGTAIVLHETVGRIRQNTGIRGEDRTRLNEVYSALGDQRRMIERQASYLVDIASTDARRRRSRQSLAGRFDSAAQLISLAAERSGVEIINEIPPDLNSPPMFPAELMAVFSNILSNALKASKEGKKIRARGEHLSDGGVMIIVENTGEVVDPEDSERWFKPFESTTVDVDSSVGYGMGLGLTITREILEQYGVSIRFVEPDGQFATAVEIVFPTGS